MAALPAFKSLDQGSQATGLLRSPGVLNADAMAWSIVEMLIRQQRLVMTRLAAALNEEPSGHLVTPRRGPGNFEPVATIEIR